jgi:hypothetical protein
MIMQKVSVGLVAVVTSGMQTLLASCVGEISRFELHTRSTLYKRVHGPSPLRRVLGWQQLHLAKEGVSIELKRLKGSVCERGSAISGTNEALNI